MLKILGFNSYRKLFSDVDMAAYKLQQWKMGSPAWGMYFSTSIATKK